MTRRIRAVGEAAVPDWVAREARKFEYPDFDTVAPTSQPSGGGGAPTIVVAASDASDLSKFKADFVCTGVNDHLTIQQAIDSLVANFGGRILLTEGVFHCALTAAFNITTQSSGPVRFEGMGGDSTVILIDTAPAVADRVLFYLGNDNTISDLQIRQTAFSQSWYPVRFIGERGWVQRCEFWTLQAPNGVVSVVDAGNFEYWITDNIFDGCPLAFRSEEAYHILFSRNVCDGTEGVEIIYTPSGGEGGLGVTVADNIWRAPDDDNATATIYIEGIDSPAVVGNVAFGTSGFPYAFVQVNTCNGAVIANNTVYQHCCGAGVSIVDSLGATVIGNHFDSFGGSGVDYGVHVSGASDGTLVVGNSLRSDQATIGNWITHGIFIEANECTVEGNLIRQVEDDCIRIEGDDNFVVGNDMLPSALTPQTEIGVHVVSGSCNIVAGNRLGDPSGYNNDALVDAGTNTQLTYPNDPTYGDNFTDCGSPGSP